MVMENGSHSDEGTKTRLLRFVPPLHDFFSSVSEVAAVTSRSLLFLVPLALIFDLAGYMPPYLRLLALYGLLALPLCRLPRPGVLRAGAVLGAVILVNAVLPLPLMAEVSLLAFAHIWIWTAAGLQSPVLVKGILFYTVLYLYLFASPLGYQHLESLAASGNGLSRWITGGTLNLGYTYQNLGSLLLFLTLSVHAWDRRLVSVFRTAAFLLIAVLLNGILSALLVYRLDLAPELVWELAYRERFAFPELAEHVGRLLMLAFPFFIFLGHALGYLLVHHDVRHGEPGRSPAPADPADAPPGLPRAWLAAAVAAIALLAIAVPPTSLRRSAPSRIVFLNDNDRCVVSFTKPRENRYGRAAGGMYGFFPEYARLFGCPAEVVEEIPDPLEPGSIFVMTNMKGPLTPEEHERIWSFVRAGGRLWVLGDHTFIKNGRNHVNDLLAPCDIALNHDSAQFYPQGWFHSYRMRQGTAFGHLRDPGENRLALLVGASLDLRPPARPLIIGRFGYSDWGPDEPDENGGYLGDFEYQASERLGDLVLVAGQAFGDGKVLVFGDTSSFFNGALTRSYELLRAALSWFGEPAGYARFHGRAAGWLAAALAAGCLALSIPARLPRAGPGLLLFLAGLSFLAHRPEGLLPLDQDVGRGRAAVIDFSHQPYASKHGNMDNGLYGLSVNLQRNDLMPLASDRWDREVLDAAGLLVLNAPRRPLSPARRRDVMHFMERGGTVLLACGYPHYPHCRPLLDPLGIKIRNLPLGRFFDRPAFNRPIHFFSAWPIEVLPPNAAVLCHYQDWPLIADVRIGQGRLILVADSQFFHNLNLEDIERYSLPNIQFIRSLLDYVNGARPP